MKVKRFATLATLAVAFFSSALLAGCASAPQSAEKVQAAVATACPVVQVALADLSILGTLPDNLQADIAKAQPVIDQVCAGNASLDATSLSGLVQTTFPALIADVGATALPDSTKAKVTTAFAAAQIALTAVLQLLPHDTVSGTAAAATQ